MRFEWDENKNRSNISKHGIDFEQAKKIFEDPNLLTYEDARFSYGEIREIFHRTITTDNSAENNYCLGSLHR